MSVHVSPLARESHVWVGCWIAWILGAGLSHSGSVAAVDEEPAGIRLNVHVWVASVAVTPDGKLIGVGTLDNQVRLFEAESGVCRFTKRVADIDFDAPAFVEFSPDGRRLAGYGRSGTARLWDVATGEETLALGGHENIVSDLIFWQDGTTLATASHDDAIRVWDAASGKLLRAFSQEFPHDPNELAINPAGDLLAATYRDGNVRLWDPRDGTLRATLEGHRGGVSAVGFTPDGHRLATAGQDGTVRIWDPTTGKAVLVIEAGQEALHVLAISSDGTRLATSGRDGTVRVWDLATGAPHQTLEVPGSTYLPMVFMPGEHVLLIGAQDGTVETRPLQVP